MRRRSFRPRMPLRTALLDTVARHAPRFQVERLDLEGIRRSRARVIPAKGPFAWVVGSIPEGVEISQATCPARDGARLAIRVYRPRAAGRVPVVVHFHGGGWVLGSTEAGDSFCAHLASQVPALVLSVDYRMAPESKAPQAAYDAVDAVRWAGAEAGALGGDPSRLAVCGDSAGGNLAAVACQRIRDEGGPAIALQALLYPATDLTRSFPSIREFADGPVLTRASMDAFLAHYLAGAAVDATDPLVSPYWLEDLSGLPAALVQTADLDPLRDEGQAYAARLSAAGVPVRATNYLRSVHGFASFPGATINGAQARLELVTELRRALGTAPAAPTVPARNGTVPARNGTVPARNGTVPARNGTVPAEPAA